MRIFISCLDDSGSKRTTRLNITNCTTTSQLIREICKELNLSKNWVIIKLKYEPENLRIIDGWPISQYPVKNGSTFIIEYNERYFSRENIDEELQNIQEEGQFSDDDNSTKLSFISDKGEHDDNNYLEQCLAKFLGAVREGNLEEIAKIIKEQPSLDNQIQVERIMKKKLNYLLNELGDCGRNALHWAIHTNNPDVVSFLIIKGTNPTILTIDQYTPLQLAVQHRSPEIIKLLLQQKKIDINQVTSKGTALHLAVVNEDLKCIQILLQNQADPQTANHEHKKVIEVCKNERIKSIIQRKIELIKYAPPNITKGNIFKVTSMTYRLKQKILIINPFKNQLRFEADGQVQEKLKITTIKKVEKIEQKSWLMKDKYNYFKIIFEENEVLLAVQHLQIYKKWMNLLIFAQKYCHNNGFNRIIPANEQTIQILDDDKNQITLHKRKTQNLPQARNSISIMNLKSVSDTSISYENQQKIKRQLKLTKQGDSDSIASIEDDRMRQSQIIIGSIIQKQEVYSKSAPPKAFEFPLQSLINSPEKDKSHTEESDQKKYKFRKNSEQKIECVSEFKAQQKIKVSYQDFQIVKLLGNGAFGQVYLTIHKATKKSYALKVLNKKKLINKKQLKYAVGEAKILKRVESPFIIKLYYAFQTPLNLYMALDNCLNGDLSELIIVKDKLTESTAKFIIAQLILAIQYLHTHQILYRDLKPENILIANDGFIRLTDFGLSRENSFSMSFCGSPAYLSPEMLQKKGVGFSTDIYGIGCVLYQMVVGTPPFFDENIDNLFENIKSGKLKYPSFLSHQIKSLINKLLQRDVSKRLGVKDFKQIKNHDFFKKFDWNGLQKKSIKPPNQMFINEANEDYFGMINLQKNQNLKLVDNDYNQSTSMLNRIKNFTFIRQSQNEINNKISKNELKTSLKLIKQ